MNPLLFLLAASTATSAVVAALALVTIADGTVAAARAVEISAAVEATAGGTVGATRSITAALDLDTVAGITLDAVKDSPQSVEVEAVAGITLDAVKDSPQGRVFGAVADGSLGTYKVAVPLVEFDAVADGAVDGTKAVEIGVSFDAIADGYAAVQGRFSVTFEAVAGGTVAGGKGAIAGTTLEAIAEGALDGEKGAIAGPALDVVGSGSVVGGRGAVLALELESEADGTMSGSKAVVTAAAGGDEANGSIGGAKGAIASPALEVVGDGLVVFATSKALLRATVGGDRRVTVDGDRRATNLLAPITSVRLSTVATGAASGTKDSDQSAALDTIGDGAVDYEAALNNDFKYSFTETFAAVTEKTITIPINGGGPNRRAVVCVVPLWNVNIGAGVIQITSTGFGTGSGSGNSTQVYGGTLRVKGARMISGVVDHGGNISVTIGKQPGAPAGSFLIGYAVGAWFFDSTEPDLETDTLEPPSESLSINVAEGAKVFALIVRLASATPITPDWGGFFDDEEFEVNFSGFMSSGGNDYAYSMVSLEYEGASTTSKSVDAGASGDVYGGVISWVKS